MIMQILRNNASGVVPVIAIGSVVLGILLFTSLSLMQRKATSRYGLYLFMIMNSCGAVWQHQRLLMLQAMNMLDNAYYEFMVLFCVQLGFVVVIYIPLLLILRKYTYKPLQR